MTETQTPQIIQPDLAVGRIDAQEVQVSPETLDKVKAGMLGATAVKTEVEPVTQAQDQHINAALLQHFGERIAARRDTQMSKADTTPKVRASHIEQDSATRPRQSVTRREFMSHSR